MSRNEYRLDDGRLLAIGWDYLDSGSFYAQVMDKAAVTEDNHIGLVIEIGSYIFHDPPFRFDIVATTSELALQLAKHGIELTSQQVSLLEADTLARGSGLSPLQQRIQDDRRFGILTVELQHDGSRD